MQTLNKTKMEVVKISTDKIITSDAEFAVGVFSIPPNHDTKATLTEGCIPHVTLSMIKSTCSELPRSSGRAILRKTGELVGISVCITKMEDNISASYVEFT